jgi:diguanylate cyclase (GGDEF)-like protein
VQLSSHLYRTTLNQLVAQRDLIRFARQDPLTGLDNRWALRERFEALAPGPARPAALIYLDLDGFKPINDIHGHQVGDALLRAVAARLTASLRPGDSVYRIGGDEFVMLLPRVRQRSDTTEIAGVAGVPVGTLPPG